MNNQPMSDAEYEAYKKSTFDFIRGAVEFPLAYLSSGAIWENRHPLDVMFIWDESGCGEVARFNLRDDLVEAFSDDPAHYRERMLLTEKALRDLADEIAAIRVGADSKQA